VKTILSCTVAIAALATALPAFSATLADGATDGVGAPPVTEVVVSATRTLELATRIGSSVTVLDQAAIQDSQAIAVSDLITQTPGVSFSRNGGYGTTTQLRIRGAETDQTVVVIDGVKLNDPASAGGGFNFADLLTGDIARIEVLRGAQSTLWGSQAIGGVVNITTAMPTKSFEGSVQAEGGTLNTGSVKASVGGTTDHFTWQLAGNSFTTEGVSAYRFGKERDGDANSGLSGRALIKLTDYVSVDLRSVYSTNRFEFDATSADRGDVGKTREFVTYTGLNFDTPDGRLKNRLSYGYTDTDRFQLNPAQAVTTTTFDSAGANRDWQYQGVLALVGDWNATLGAETEDQRMRTRSPTASRPTSPYVRGAADINSLYAQVHGSLVQGLTLTAGVRNDDHSTFGSHTVGQAALAWSLNDGGTILRSSWGQGFKAPTLYQLFSDNSNPNLLPETANSWDAGIEQQVFNKRLIVSATYFHRDTTNQIDFVSCPNANPLCTAGPSTRLGFYANTTKTQAQGLELAATAQLTSRLTLEANYTWTDATNQTAGVNFGKRLVRRPENAANAWLTYAWPNKLKTSVSVRYNGDSFDQPNNVYVLKAYTVVDLKAAYPLNDKVDLFGRVENVGDADYETARNFGVLRRGLFAGVRARF
jgi:vitamin B12 transporter